MDVNPNIQAIKPYTPGKPIDEVKRELGLDHVIKLASNENNWGLPTTVRQALSEQIHDLFLYPDGSLFRLRQKLSSFYAVSPDQLIFGNGSDELLQLIALTYLNHQTEVLVSEGTFSEYAFSAALVDAPIRRIPLRDYTYDLDAFRLAISPQTKVIFLCNPNNPTGTY